MHEMTEQEKKAILDACEKMETVQGFIFTIQINQKQLETENKNLKEKIEEEVRERKEEINKMHDEFKDMEEKIENRFEIFFHKLGEINKRIDEKIKSVTDKIDAMLKQQNKFFIGIFSAIILFILTNFLGRILGWF